MCCSTFWLHKPGTLLKRRMSIETFFSTSFQILFNDKKVAPDISKNGIRITSSGLYVVVEIPELEVYVSYSRLAFYVKLPFGKFYNNTMGLCGECLY